MSRRCAVEGAVFRSFSRPTGLSALGLSRLGLSRLGLSAVVLALLLALLVAPRRVNADPAPVVVPPGGPGSYVNFRTQHNSVQFIGDTGWILVTVCTPTIVRVQAGPSSDGVPPDNVLVGRDVWRDVRFTMEDLGDRMEMHTGAVDIDVHKRPLRVDFYSTASHPLSLDRSGIHWADGACDDTRACDPDEHFYGFGLQFHSFDQRGKDRLLKTNADTPTDTGESHVVAPFFISTAGYGIFLDSTGYTRFHMGSDDPGRLAFSAPDPVLDYYFIAGPSFRDIIARYTLITGRMRMPPRWGLGFWYRVKSDWSEAQVQRAALEFRSRDIPCDVLGLEPGWQSQSYPCSFEWNLKRFPDPPTFVQWTLDHGFHLNLWEHAYTSAASPLYRTLKDAQVVADQTVWKGAIPDFSLQKAKDLFAEFQDRETASLGVSGYKLDEDDGSDYTGGWFFPDSTHFPSGLTGAAMHNVFGYLYQRAIQEMFDRKNLRTFLLSRGGYAGSQAYPVAAYSDSYGFREYIRAACNSGFSGVLWCPEVRQGGSDEEFARRCELALLSPVAMINAWDNGVLPWSRGAAAEQIFRKYDDLRMQLVPYLYDAFWQDHQDGIPVVRPLLMDYPTDLGSRECDDEYFLGDSILVAPVMNGVSRAVYLPPGRWTNFWTGLALTGGRTVDVSAPLDREPLFIKEAALIPMAEAPSKAGGSQQAPVIAAPAEAAASASIAADPVATERLLAYPGTVPGASILYDDDGVTTRYLGGGRAEVRVEMSAVARTGLVIKIHTPEGRFTWPARTITVEIRGLGRSPSAIRDNGKLLKESGTASDVP
ncbi:MAG: DUF4968 domain-containing protein, partial [Chloroflexi bacterium]|nr:DUF4968 domain-containing protein [Chloroflexota bacterium]